MGNRERLVLNVKEASELMDLSRGSIYQGIITGEIPSVKVGKRILIPRLSLEKMLAEASNKAASRQK